MSASVDARRREDAHAAAVERGKAQLRALQSVLTHFVEGLTAAESAERLTAQLGRSRPVHRITVQRWRYLLLLTRGPVRRVDSNTADGGD